MKYCSNDNSEKKRIDCNQVLQKHSELRATKLTGQCSGSVVTNVLASIVPALCPIPLTVKVLRKHCVYD